MKIKIKNILVDKKKKYLLYIELQMDKRLIIYSDFQYDIVPNPVVLIQKR